MATKDLTEALEHHRQGRLDEAEAACRSLLRRDPKFAEALHLRGVIALQRGRHDDATVLLGKAIAADGKMARYHVNLGLAQRAQGDTAAAMASYRQAVECDPTSAMAHNNLGSLLRAEGKLAEATSCFRHAIDCDPDLAIAHVNLGNALREVGNLDGAVVCYRRAARLVPREPEGHVLLGEVLVEQGHLALAADCFRHGLTLMPNHLAALTGLASVLLRQEKAQDAIDVFQRAIAADPARRRDYMAGATESFRRSLPLDAEHVEAHCNIGMGFAELGETERALASFRQVLSIVPDNAEAHFGLGVALLQSGDYANGWRDYEWRRQLPDWGSPKQRRLTPRLWRGEPLAGARILLHAEQGLGDTLQFIRYAPLVAARGGRVFVWCQKNLVRLLRGIDGVEAVVGDDDVLPEVDFQCPLLSLPHVFGTDLATIPAAGSYLRVDADERRVWRDRLAAAAGRRVGLVWAGAPGYRGDAQRSLSLAAFAPLAAVAKVEFVSLQKGPAAWHLTSSPAGMVIRDVGAALDDFADTAAAIANLDLVIAVDTAVAHLAGALGKPVWILLPYAADWRWLVGRDDSPWYRSARLFRQPAPGAWTPVIEAVAAALPRLKASW